MTKLVLGLLMMFAVLFTLSNVYAEQDKGKLQERIELVEDRTIDYEVKLDDHIWNFHVWTEAFMKQIESIVADIANHQTQIDDLDSQVQIHELWFDTYDTREAIQDTRIEAIETGLSSTDTVVKNIESGTILLQKQIDDHDDRIHELEVGRTFETRSISLDQNGINKVTMSCSTENPYFVLKNVSLNSDALKITFERHFSILIHADRDVDTYDMVYEKSSIASPWTITYVCSNQP